MGSLCVDQALCLRLPGRGWNSAPTPPEGPGPGKASFFPVTTVGSCFKGHIWGFAWE